METCYGVSGKLEKPSVEELLPNKCFGPLILDTLRKLNLPMSWLLPFSKCCLYWGLNSGASSDVISLKRSAYRSVMKLAKRISTEDLNLVLKINVMNSPH